MDLSEVSEQEHPDVEGAVPGKQPKTVYVKVVFLKLGEIETVKEQFVADVFIQARWREQVLDSCKSEKVDFNKYWNPNIQIQNLTSSTKRNKWNEIRFGKSGEAFIVERRRISGTFTEKMELEDFPFDSQDLSILMTSDLPVKEVILEEDNQDLSTINVASFADEQEWFLSDHVESNKSVIRKEFTQSKNVEFPVLRVSCIATRQFMFFVWNIIIITFIISTLSFATFSVDRTLPQNRLQLAFTLTLTGVTFRFVANQSLPKISYLTKLDKYILFCMIFNFLVSVWHAGGSQIDDGTAADGQHDFWAFIFFIILYSSFQLLFFLTVLIRYLVARQKIEMKMKAYQEKAVLVLGQKWSSNRRVKSDRNSNRINPTQF
ncbi:gamma-aminobutyric acid receptor subunit gamma-2-like isoform X1 [Mizuhopecten yessoensis]|nr:gamma-aminobutyric acid receptor subunit gamma-2-like isoform X1 [Mizuhopecten yessoensis]XP_021342814.1 gamma-aminobutyric acid receptor subunit gamma-2-like isoform X1 [Mizuhopecten yessoensis]